MTMAQQVRPELLEILACPTCKTAVKQDGDFIQCQNPDCRLRFPIRNDIPIMLIEEAVVADPGVLSGK
jgi:uncharacterized protein